MTWTVSSIVRRLVDLDETDRVEGKAGLGEASMKSISAFSNEVDLRGGWIVFGVRREGTGAYELIGLNDPDKLQTDLATRCKGVFNRPITPTIRVERIDGMRIAVAFIQEASAGEKPIFIKKRGLPKGAYRRVGSSDMVVTDADLARFASLANSVPYDRRKVAGASPSDIDIRAVEAYRQQLRAGRPGSELLLLNDHDLLEAIGALWDGVPTYAGLVLFGRRAALRRFLPAMRVDVLIARGAELGDDYEVIEVSEALVTAWRKVFQAVSDTLPRRITLTNESPTRVETPKIPELALREAIVNALIHRDLEVGASIQVRRYADRLEVENPGYSLVAPEDWGKLRSVARNTTVAQAFTELDLAETRGTGMRRMMTRMHESGLQPPVWDSNRENNHFLLTLKFHHLLDEADWSWLERFDNLDDVDRQVLVLALRDKTVRNEGVRLVSGDGTLPASHRLARLRDQGLLEQHGSSKAETWYILTEEARPDSATAPVRRESSNLEGLSSNLEGLSSNLEGLSSNLEGLSSNLEGTSRLDGAGGGQLDLLAARDEQDGPPQVSGHPEVPPDLARELQELPARANQEQVAQVVLKLCRLGWWEPQQLALAVGRSRRYLTQHFLQPMVEDGRLSLRFPEKHNPRQAYGVGSGPDAMR